jgi:hypothetical protein
VPNVIYVVTQLLKHTFHPPISRLLLFQFCPLTHTHAHTHTHPRARAHTYTHTKENYSHTISWFVHVTSCTMMTIGTHAERWCLISLCICWRHVTIAMSLFHVLWTSHITPPEDLKGNNIQLSQNVIHSDTVEKLFLFSSKPLPKNTFILA